MKQETLSIVACLAMLLAVGCGKKREPPPALIEDPLAARVDGKATSLATEANVEIDKTGARVDVETDEGKVVVSNGEQTELPANTWSDVPIAEGSRMMQSVDTEPQGFTEDGKVRVSSGEQTERPANIWPDVPIPEGSRIMQSVDTEPQGFTVLMATDEGLADALATVKRDLKAEGWTTERIVDRNNGVLIIAAQGDRHLHTVVMTVGEETHITTVGIPEE